ncbi:MAG: Ig-like domain-containing domain [Chitinophagales bacterium]|nr:Ig-like domain-containing domain [Chitinophagales bacterium]MDW8418633.1 Ig-like domain-containing domain [Chitinophagales bacterium]
MKDDTILWLALFAAFLGSCATESAPLGGKQDTEPPKLIRAEPPDKSINFSNKNVTLYFNEYLQTSFFPNTNVSPELPVKPDIKIKGKKLLILFKSELLPNKTYTINFFDDVRDLNEGNKLNNFRYVFSTGNYIDSLRINGSVFYAESGEPAKEVIVGLYSTSEDNSVLFKKPLYYTKTNDAGAFSIENISAGEYAIYALKDLNTNLLYDQPSELVGFVNKTLILTDTTQPNISIPLFQSVPSNIKLISYKNPHSGLISLKYNMPIQNLRAESQLFENGYKIHTTTTKDSINIWYSDIYKKNASILITVNDTLIDTLTLQLKYIHPDSTITIKNNPLSIVIEEQSKKGIDKITKQQIPLYEPIKFILTRPALHIHRPLIISDDSTKKSFTVSCSIDDKNPHILILDFIRKPATSYTIYFPDSAISDIFNLHNKAHTYKVITKTKEQYGNITLKISNADTGKKYIIQLIDGNKQIVWKQFMYQTTQETFQLKNMPEGDYYVRVIEDENGNGEWDNGNIYLKAQPEKIHHFKEKNTLKGGWDMEVEVNLTNTAKLKMLK